MLVVALVTAQAARARDEDLPLLAPALEREGIAHDIVVWNDVTVDWSRFSLAVIRSTWDYAKQRDAFVAWAHAIPTRLLNAPNILEWNTDKHYLRDLAERGVPTIPTAWFEPSQDAAYRFQNNVFGGDIVVKPTVSAGAMDTARYAEDARAQAEVHARGLLAAGRAVMVQPYLRAVDERGETSLLFFNGEFSHAVRKGPLLRGSAELVAGLYVRDEISPREPSASELAVANATLDALPFPSASLLYARVDLLPQENGSPVLGELEITEPSLYLKYSEGAADRFAKAIAKRVRETP